MKTRTRQNGVAGLMSRLIRNIKAAALALAAPPALADLPTGYKQIEYIQSSGTQRIKTGSAATLWVVYSTAPLGGDPGEFAAPGEWDGCVKLGDVTADGTTGDYALGNPLSNGYRTMRFVVATSGSTESNLVPLLVSEPYKTLRAGTTLYLR